MNRYTKSRIYDQPLYENWKHKPHIQRETTEQTRTRLIKLLKPGGVYICKDEDSVKDCLSIRTDVLFYTPQQVENGELEKIKPIVDLVCDPEFVENNSRLAGMTVRAAIRAYKYKNGKV